MGDNNKQIVADDGDKDDHKSNSKGDGSLEDFVTDHYQMQKDEGKMSSTAELSDERTSQFFARAIAESRRMSGEVAKSNRKLDSLHAEFGLDRVNAWQEEHASEVLQPHEQELIKQAQYQGST